jgi:hypothetical protein
MRSIGGVLMFLSDLEPQLHVLWPYPAARVWNDSFTETMQVFCHSTMYQLGFQFIANCKRLVHVYENGDQIWTNETISALGLAALIEKVRSKYPLIDASSWVLE